MALVPPPPPTKSEPGSFAWMSWYQSLYYYLTTAGSVTWASIDKTGSNLTDIATRLHSSLQGIAGAGEYHISAAQATNVSNLSGTNTGDQTITLTGDVTGSGTGSFAATLATVNANVGSFGSSTSIPSYTVNGKGLITASSSNVVIAPAGTLTGATLAAGVTASSLTSVGTLTSVTISGNTLINGVGGLGYTTGSGGAVTQLTSKATGVTLNKTNGAITLNNAALAAATSVAFTLTNSTIAASDAIHVNIKSGATSLAYITQVEAVAAGSCVIAIRNQSAGSLSEAIVLTFAVIKAVTS